MMLCPVHVIDNDVIVMHITSFLVWEPSPPCPTKVVVIDGAVDCGTTFRQRN